MNRRVLTIVVSALILSLCASYLVYRAVGKTATAGKAPQSVQIVVAARDLAVGTLIHEDDVKMSAWLGSAPKGSTTKVDSVLNRGVVSAIYASEPITDSRLALQGSGAGLAATIPAGMRACAVKVNDVVGVAGFVVPGMRVDVLITGLPPGGNSLEGPSVRTLLQNIQVLSAGTNFQKDQEGKPEQAQVVNLLVTPAQAEMLSLASNETRIQLVLRNPMDTQISATPGIVVSDLFGRGHLSGPGAADSPPMNLPKAGRTEVAPVAVPAPASRPNPYVIEVTNGAVHTQATFSLPGGTQ
jgi:pilus assembly protein CpaB